MSMNPDALVRLEGVAKSFGPTVALHELNLNIAQGEFVTFLGPSGCGKSTTLRILGGFEAPDRGRVVIDGRDVTRRPPNRRNVNMVFQDYALFPHMSVRRNISFGLELKGLSRGDMDRRIDELAEFLELSNYLDRRPEQLSGGQRQRVALARALAPDPALLLLDEPLGALDAKLRGQVQQELKDIQRRTGKTFFFVTHDQDEALSMADRIVVMNAGRVEQDGAPEALYHHPESRFVAEFIGDTNLLDARILGWEGDRAALDWGGARLQGVGGSARPGAGAAVTASLRLEKILLSKTRPDTANAVQGRLIERVFKGSHSIVSIAVDAADGAILRAFSVNPPVAHGEPVWAGFSAGALAVLGH